ncbi:MAG: PilZ domain-containing protein [Burkholderiaceae bacterium]
MTDDKREEIKAAIADALERRRGARKPLAVPAGLVVAGKQLTARTIDIGLRGLAIEVDEALPAKAECFVVLALPGEGRSHTLRLHATVVYGMGSPAHGYKAGLELRDLSADDARLIEQFIA